MKISDEPVWIVDDDESIRWVLTQALKKQGIEAKSFISADDALEQFGRESPKIIVTDIRMEGMDGLTLLERVHSSSPNLPIIVMTAYSDLDTTIESFQRGAREHLPKPFDIDVAITLIQQVMDEVASDVEPEETQDSTRTSMIGDSVPMQEVFSGDRQTFKI